MPAYVIHQVIAALNARKKALNGAKILVLGLAYKADVDDDRESPSYVLMTSLKERGAEVSYHDPCVPVIKLTREHPQWAGVKSIPWNQKSIKAFDLVRALTDGGPGISTQLPTLVVYDFMFQRGLLGRGTAAAVLMLLTLLAVLAPYAVWKRVQKRRAARA